MANQAVVLAYFRPDVVACGILGGLAELTHADNHARHKSPGTGDLPFAVSRTPRCALTWSDHGTTEVSHPRTIGLVVRSCKLDSPHHSATSP